METYSFDIIPFLIGWPDEGFLIVEGSRGRDAREAFVSDGGEVADGGEGNEGVGEGEGEKNKDAHLHWVVRA